ncbi:hypothetical protein CLU79DRAFT_694833, partial [Phycomyces nitens]
TSVSDDEKIFTTRSNASINTVGGVFLGQSVGCGEVKPQHQALNHKTIAKIVGKVYSFNWNDTIHIIHLILFFYIGDHSTFYILSRTQEHLYLICGIEHIQLPIALEQSPLLLPQLNKVMKIIASFAQAARRENHNHAHHPPTLPEHTLVAITDPKPLDSLILCFTIVQ